MKEVKQAKKRQEELLEQIEEQRAHFEGLLIFGQGGDSMEKTTVRFQRDALYQEIWEISLSKVAKKYGIPNGKLKEACEKAKIPLPTLSYWSSLQVGKTVEKTPLPDAEDSEVVIEFNKRVTGLRNILAESAAEQKMPVSSEPQIAPQIETDNSIKRTASGRTIYDRETLYHEVWEQSVSKVAQKYGVSDVMIHKVCKSLNIPVPPRGYWAKVQAGQTPPKEPLPKTTGKTSLIGRKEEDRKQTTIQARDRDLLSFLSDAERARILEAALSLHVEPEVKKLHPVLQKHKTMFTAWAKQHPRDKYADWNRDKYRSTAKQEPPLWESVTEETLPRVYRFLDALYRTVEMLGGTINDDLSLEIRNEHVILRITEGRDQTAHVLTADEQRQLEKYEQEKKRYSYVREPTFRKYDYIPNGKLRIRAYGDNFSRDSSTSIVENRIGEILLALYVQSENVRIEREKREEAQRKAEEEKRQKELRLQRYNEETDKTQALVNEAVDFETACRIRAYIAAIESKPDLDEKTLEWIAWAKAKADWYDPTVSANDPVFGERKHGADAKDKTPVKKSSYYN